MDRITNLWTGKAFNFSVFQKKVLSKRNYLSGIKNYQGPLITLEFLFNVFVWGESYSLSENSTPMSADDFYAESEDFDDDYSDDEDEEY